MRQDGKKATDPQMRKAYEEQQKRWLEIAEALWNATSKVARVQSIATPYQPGVKTMVSA